VIGAVAIQRNNVQKRSKRSKKALLELSEVRYRSTLIVHLLEAGQNVGSEDGKVRPALLYGHKPRTCLCNDLQLNSTQFLSPKSSLLKIIQQHDHHLKASSVFQEFCRRHGRTHLRF
jgi:hypothetical protein